MNTELLNAIKDKVIAWANEQQISLADHFESPAKFREWLISLAITQLMQAGNVDLPTAFDVVCGDGAYKRLADTVWAECNA